MSLLTMAGRLLVVLLCAHQLIAALSHRSGFSDEHDGQRAGIKVRRDDGAAEQERTVRILNKKEPASLSDYKIDCKTSRWYIGEDGQLKECKNWENPIDKPANWQENIHETEIKSPLHVYLPRLPTAGLPIWSSIPLYNLWTNPFPGNPSSSQTDEKFDKKKPVDAHVGVQEHEPILELMPVIAQPIVVHKPVVLKPTVIKPIHKPISHPLLVHKPHHHVVKPVNHWHIPIKLHKPNKGHHKTGHDAVVGGIHHEDIKIHSHLKPFKSTVESGHLGDFHSTGHKPLSGGEGKDTLLEGAEPFSGRPIFFPLFPIQLNAPYVTDRLLDLQNGKSEGRVDKPHFTGPGTQETSNPGSEDSDLRTNKLSAVHITPKPDGSRTNESPPAKRQIINVFFQPSNQYSAQKIPGMMVRSMLPNIVKGIRFRHSIPQLGLNYQSKVPVEETLDRLKSVINESIKPTKFPGVQQFETNQKLRLSISGNKTDISSIKLGNAGKETAEREVQTKLDNWPREPVHETLVRVKNIITATSEPTDNSEVTSEQAKTRPKELLSPQEQEDVHETLMRVKNIITASSEPTDNSEVTSEQAKTGPKELLLPQERDDVKGKPDSAANEESRRSWEGEADQVIHPVEPSQPVSTEDIQAKMNDAESNTFLFSTPKNIEEVSGDSGVTTEPTIYLDSGPDLLEDADESTEHHVRRNREAPGVPIDILNDERETILGRTTLLEIMSALKEQYMKNAEPDQKKLIEDAFARLHCSVRNMNDLDERPAKNIDSPKKATLELLAETQPLMDEPDYYSDAADDTSAEPSFLELLNVATKHKGKSHESDVLDA